MQRALVAIGVDAPASDFPRLRAAADGAKQIAAWGKTQGFDVALLTDEDGNSVALGDVFTAVKKFVDARVYSQLVVYFSGHGILVAADTEVWLLSGALSNPNDAVNVSGSVTAARTSGIPHVVFVSDACRSMPSQFRMGLVTPGLIFPPRQPQPRSQQTEVDSFYATLPGDVALEVGPTEAKNAFRGLLTSCMLDALQGMPPSIVERVKDSDGSRRVVASRPLKEHLVKAVPSAAAAVSVTLNQMPDIRVESALPKYLADLSLLRPKRPQKAPAKAPPAAEADLKTLAYTFTKSWKQTLEPTFNGLGELELAGNDDIRQEVESIVEAGRRVSNEIQTGFAVSGAKVHSVILSLDARHRVWESEGATQINIDYWSDAWSLQRGKGLALVRFADGTGVALSVLRRFVGSVVVDSGVVRTVNYAPSGEDDFRSPSAHVRRIEERRAVVAVAARHGSFRLGKKSANRIADYLRRYKSYDPTLGLYAAYAYAQAGNDDEVLSVFGYMARDSAPVLFDVAMLAAQRARRGRYSDRPAEWGAEVLRKKDFKLDFAPWLPVLTQGWMLMGRYGDAMPPVLREASRHLLPGLWTTFAKEGMDLLEKSLKGARL